MMPRVDVIVVLQRSDTAALMRKGTEGSPAVAEGSLGQSWRTEHDAEVCMRQRTAPAAT